MTMTSRLCLFTSFFYVLKRALPHAQLRIQALEDKTPLYVLCVRDVPDPKNSDGALKKSTHAGRSDFRRAREAFFQELEELAFAALQDKRYAVALRAKEMIGKERGWLRGGKDKIQEGSLAQCFESCEDADLKAVLSQIEAAIETLPVLSLDGVAPEGAHEENPHGPNR